MQRSIIQNITHEYRPIMQTKVPIPCDHQSMSPSPMSPLTTIAITITILIIHIPNPQSSPLIPILLSFSLPFSFKRRQSVPLHKLLTLPI